MDMGWLWTRTGNAHKFFRNFGGLLPESEGYKFTHLRQLDALGKSFGSPFLRNSPYLQRLEAGHTMGKNSLLNPFCFQCDTVPLDPEGRRNREAELGNRSRVHRRGLPQALQWARILHHRCRLHLRWKFPRSESHFVVLDPGDHKVLLISICMQRPLGNGRNSGLRDLR